MRPIPPVVVIGAGPVGQTTALLLARWGVPSVVLDRRAGREVAGSRSICQHRDVLDVWSAVGAGGRIAAEGVTWTTARTFCRDRELFSVTVADRGRSAFPPFVNISQRRTEQILDEQIARQPLIEVRWGHEAVGVAEHSDGVVVGCAHGERILGSYAVLCAGARDGGLRERLGVQFAGQSYDDRFLICDIRTDLASWRTERRFFFDPEWNPGRQVLIHPCPDSTCRIDWQVPPGFDLAAEQQDGRLARRISQVVGDRPYEVVWATVYRFHERVADRMRVGRVLLAGDCAHLYAPFGARGLNSGVQDAENAAWKLGYVLRGWASPALLESYHDERHAAALENLEVTSRTMRFLAPQTDQQRAWRREVLNRAAGDPAACSLVDSGRLAEPFWYVDSPLTTPDASRQFAGRPPRGQAPPAGPGVLVPDLPVRDPADRQVRRLREMVRDGFLALHFSGAWRTAGLRQAGPGPFRALAVAEIDVEGLLADALGARPGEVWLVRPDGHVAAVLAGPDESAVTRAARRALGGRP